MAYRQPEQFEKDSAERPCPSQWHSDCSFRDASVCLNEDRKVSPTKRLLLSCAVAVLLVGASAATSEAQYRGRGRRVVVVGGFYSPFYSPFWIDPWYGLDYQWGVYPPYRYYNVAPEASLKLEVKPKEAEVYIDGYYAGIVDDFDGAFQRLHVDPGEHEIELYLDGYRLVVDRRTDKGKGRKDCGGDPGNSFTPNRTLSLRHGDSRRGRKSAA